MKEFNILCKGKKETDTDHKRICPEKEVFSGKWKFSWLEQCSEKKATTDYEKKQSYNGPLLYKGDVQPVRRIKKTYLPELSHIQSLEI